MRLPTTAAGRALLDRLGNLPKLMPYDAESMAAILAIEAEARQQDGSALRAAASHAIQAWHRDTPDDAPNLHQAISELDAALAALPSSTKDSVTGDESRPHDLLHATDCWCEPVRTRR